MVSLSGCSNGQITKTIGITSTASTNKPLPTYLPEPTSTKTNPATIKTSPVPVEKNTRTEVISYTVQTGDTIFGIAQMFNLKPETIIWGNPEIYENHNVVMKTGLVLNILPVDGAYHRWKAGEDLKEVARIYGVSAEAIVNWPPNHLDSLTLGDYSNPSIEPGTMLVIPGGTLPFTDSTLPNN